MDFTYTYHDIVGGFLHSFVTYGTLSHGQTVTLRILNSINSTKRNFLHSDHRYRPYSMLIRHLPLNGNF